jgi:hypothetical protein
MVGLLETAGERLLLESEIPWVSELAVEASGESLAARAGDSPTLIVAVERLRQPFPTVGWRLLARGAFARGHEVVIENACASGFDLHLRLSEVPTFTVRWRPPARERAASKALRARFQLLARATLMQYPALWAAGLRGRVPLHASGCIAGGKRTLVVSAGGIGRSTLLLREVSSGALTTGDNIAVGDGSTLWGLVEPWRVTEGDGRRMYHGRRELSAGGRIPSLDPAYLVVLERGENTAPELGPCSAMDAARSLATATYMAGELRRYWGFAAALAAGTGTGPAHPPIADVAAAFSARLPCLTLRLGNKGGPGLTELLDREEVAAWAC